MARVQVNDAEPPHADAATAVGVVPGIIRSSMNDGIAHRLHRRGGGGAIPMNKTGNSTHNLNCRLVETGLALSTTE